ncbi:MAG: PP2C family serine/threonine-protein phosphatase [Vicinamibacterales bacterium]
MLYAFGITDAGKVRKTNEDAFVSEPALRLFAVADGMGGHNAGEVASGLAIDALTTFIKRSSSDTDFSWPYGIDRTLSFDGNRLRTGIHLANRRVYRAAESSDDYSGMGTTIAGLLVNGSTVSIGHVGDSRAYLFSNQTLHSLTRDDSWAATILAQDPAFKPEEIAQHPMRNVLTSVLGARENVDVHLAERPLVSGDLLMLCSDGVHGVVSPDTIRDILTSTTDLEAASRRLIEAAMDKGSRDNVTAVVVRYEAER